MKTPLFMGVAVAIFITTGAAAADMRDLITPMMPMVMATHAPTWNDCYVGGHLRISSEVSRTNTINTFNGGLDRTDGYNKTTAHDGLQVGCDLMIASNIAVGGVADISSGGLRDQIFTDPTGTISFMTHTDDHAAGTVRGRIGYAFANLPILGNALLYGTGGWAWMSSTINRTQLLGVTGLAVVGTVESVRINRGGPTGGVGLEWYFGGNWTWFLQYRYTDFGSATANFPIAQRAATTTITQNAFELGLNYRF